jgi:hypothetical protein
LAGQQAARDASEHDRRGAELADHRGRCTAGKDHANLQRSAAARVDATRLMR